jgi:Zn-dependent peptidase ImmA (M78 family)/DNA-binding XRE family transcriptional regulator
MTKRANHEMVQLARESRRMTQKELAQAAGLTQGFISLLEAGEKEGSGDSIDRIGQALRYPADFFYLDDHYNGFGLSLVFYRKKSSALVSHLRWLQAEVNIRRIQIKRLLRGIDEFKPRQQFCRIDIDDQEGNAERIAGMVRANWNLPLGPIKNLIATIESAGGIVFKFPFGTRDIDAISQWPDDAPPLFFINSQAPADRIRFSLAHELGHIVMHRLASENLENEADRFASEFLMPARDIGHELMDVDLQRAAALKPYWRVSMAAIIKRAKDLGKLPNPDYTALFRRLSYLGYRTNEPGPIAPEEPTLVRQILDAYQITNGYTIDALARLSAVYSDEFSARYLPAIGLRLAN